MSAQVPVLAWMLGVYGLTLIITGSSLFEPVRLLFRPIDEMGGRKKVGRARALIGTLLHCPMCAGFWVGMSLSFAGFCFILPPDAPSLPPEASHLLNGFAASATCWIAHVLLASLGAEKL